MAIRIKVDEDLPAEVAHRLESAGHDARTVRDEALSGTSDESLWKMIQQEQRWLFTADKGFANAQAYPPGTHGGIVLLRLPRESRAGFVRLAESFLESIEIENAAGSVIVVTPDSIRVHRGR